MLFFALNGFDRLTVSGAWNRPPQGARIRRRGAQGATAGGCPWPGDVEGHAIATHDLLTDAAVSAFSRTTLRDTIPQTDSVAVVAAINGHVDDRLRILTCASW